MIFNIRKMNKDDKVEVISMMEVFYASDAVSTDGSPEIFNNDFENCIDDNPFWKVLYFVILIMRLPVMECLQKLLN